MTESQRTKTQMTESQKTKTQMTKNQMTETQMTESKMTKSKLGLEIIESLNCDLVKIQRLSLFQFCI
jgi:hypothetical protein